MHVRQDEYSWLQLAQLFECLVLLSVSTCDISLEVNKEDEVFNVVDVTGMEELTNGGIGIVHVGQYADGKTTTVTDVYPSAILELNMYVCESGLFGSWSVSVTSGDPADIDRILEDSFNEDCGTECGDSADNVHVGQLVDSVSDDSVLSEEVSNVVDEISVSLDNHKVVYTLLDDSPTDSSPPVD